MFVVDTNILIYAAHAPSPEHERCRSLLEEWRRGSSPWFVTWPICYEFLRVTTHPRVFDRPWETPDAFAFLEALLASPSLSILEPTPRHARVLHEMLVTVSGLRGNILHDVHTAVLMREHGISRIVTRDMDFHRFPGLTIVDPAVPGTTDLSS
ncbi:MAG: PIN domain-containing protein [Gemmatimonadales bacterium]|nr:MAG: PIN domain-containing protein [Gemmatimonadales bacterium]